MANSLQYPARFEADTDGFVVTFRDIPKANTQGDPFEHAREMAADALATAMDFYFEGRRPIPLPSAPLEGEILIKLPPEVSAAVLQLNKELANKN